MEDQTRADCLDLFPRLTMSDPAVSVVVPFFNAARFLEDSIVSVYAQSYTRWELILVDDGSSDGSTTIARAHAERHPSRVRYLDHSGHARRGVSAARNLGIRHAAAGYIALLDADDVWLPSKLAAQVQILDAHAEAAMVYPGHSTGTAGPATSKIAVVTT